jgi:RHS repeat-associated protein
VASITPSASGSATVAAYYHHDVMGSTVAATEPGYSGAAMVFNYSDFGVPGAGSGLSYTYAGYRYDSETGLYYVNARYYNPNLGRFLQTDPIGMSGGTNLYAYVGNDPINLFDPTGHGASICQDGNNITINLSTYFYGPDATPSTVNAYTTAIQSAWTGQFGQYNVNTTVSVEPTMLSIQPDTAMIYVAPIFVANTDSVGGNNMQFDSLDPNFNYQYDLWSSGHEFGHKMGLDDAYNRNTQTPYPGYENNIMGAPNGTPSGQDINDILNSPYNSVNGIGNSCQAPVSQPSAK